jgi:DNA-directed RNA polymerase specialized sigma24 family protein
MNEVYTEASIDPILLPFLQEKDEERSHRLLCQLIADHAEPVIGDVIKHKLRTFVPASRRARRPEDTEDIHSESLVQVMISLNELKSRPTERAIADFRNYVAVLTYHVIFEHLRHQDPERWRLSKKIRYVLTHQKGLALWEGSDKSMVCGFTIWRGRGEPTMPLAHLRRLVDDAEVRARHGASALQNARLIDVVTLVLNWAGRPVKFRHLVKVSALLLGMRDPALVENDFDEFSAAAEQTNNSWDDNHATRVEQRRFLEQLWKEICELPLLERTALLLNLRDNNDRGLIVLLADLRIVTIRQIAMALRLQPEEFATLWKDLPLDDDDVGERLGMTRQQVINLRRSARRRLVKRMTALTTGR